MPNVEDEVVACLFLKISLESICKLHPRGKEQRTQSYGFDILLHPRTSSKSKVVTGLKITGPTLLSHWMILLGSGVCLSPLSAGPCGFILFSGNSPILQAQLVAHRGKCLFASSYHTYSREDGIFLECSIYFCLVEGELRRFFR